MNIALATDHAGFEQLQQLQVFLQSLGHTCQNFGPTALKLDDDYPDFVAPAAQAVGRGVCQRGIILGRSGQGEAIVANRVKGVRCAVYYGPAVTGKIIDANGRVSSSPYEIARLSRLHNDANMLSIGISFITVEDMKQVTKLWLETEFSGEERHVRRINKIDNAGG